MSDRRSNIDRVLMEMLQVLKFSVRQGRGISFTTGLTESEIEVHLLAAAENSTSPSEDINAFVRRLLSDPDL